MTGRERGLVRIRVGCEFHFDAALPVPAVVLLRARSDGGVTVERETWHVQPTASFSDLVDIYGNDARRVVIGAGKASLRYDAEVTTSAAMDEVSPLAVQHRVEDLPGEILFYTLASRYCLSDLLSDAAERDEIAKKFILKSGDNEQEAVGVVRARFPNLPGIHDEILA